MASRSWKSAALSVASLLVISGCNSSSSSSRSNTVLRSTADGFPGGAVALNNLADDNQAFTNAGQVVSLPLTVSWNVSNGQAIGLFSTQPAVSFVQNSNILYAAWFDGTAWHKPVEIRGRNEDVDSFFESAVVVWLNTAGHANANAQARDGDAIILFTRPDTDVVNPTDEDSNTRAYGSYFDVSEASSPAVGTINGGFETVATIIDFDNLVVSTNAVLGGEDPDVSAIAVASDSLSGSHTMGLTGALFVDSGEPTSFLHVMYRKDPTAGDPALATDVVGDRWWSVPFDLTQVGNAIPTADATDEIDLGTLDTAANTEVVSQTLTVHNGHVFATVSPIEQAPGADDTPLIAYVFSSATPLAAPTVLEVSSARGDQSLDVATRPLAAHVYGADHGSASTLFFFEETGFEDDAALGTRAENRDILLGELRVDATGATTPGTASPLEIDGLNGTHDPADGTDADTIVTRDGINGAVTTGSLRTRINRTGTAIVAIWLQQNSDATDADPTDATRETLTPNVIPFVTVVQTRTAAADLRTLAQSVPVAGAQRSGAFESTLHSDVGAPDQFQDPCANLKFQEGLAGGQATSQSSPRGALLGVPSQRGSSFQGNPLRMSWLFTQFVDQSGTDTDNDRLLLNGLTMTLPATPAPPTFTLTNASSVVVETLDFDYSAFLGQALAVDAGDATTAGTPPTLTPAAGRVLVFFPSNETDELENLITSVDAVRYFVSEQAAAGTAGAKTLISTDPALGAQANSSQFIAPMGLMAVPVNTNVTASPGHTGDAVHLYWLEDRDVPGATFGSVALRLVSRSYDLTDTTATPVVALPARFGPALTAVPAYLDAPSSGDLLEVNATAAVLGGRNGSTAGVYFDEDGHLLYQETSTDGTGYYTDNGASDPAFVDNDGQLSFEVITYNVRFAPFGDNLPRAQAFWTKEEAGGFTNFGRGRVRVHD